MAGMDAPEGHTDHQITDNRVADDEMNWDGELTLDLPPSLTIRGIRDVHCDLVMAFDQAAALHVDCRAVTEADITAFQVLASLRRAADRSGRPLRFTLPDAGPFRDALRLSGVEEFLG